MYTYLNKCNPVSASGQANYFTPSIVSIKNTFTLTDKCVAYIMQQQKPSTPSDVVVTSDSPTKESSKTSKNALLAMSFSLSMKSILLSDKWLTDLHVDAAQIMLKKSVWRISRTTVNPEPINKTFDRNWQLHTNSSYSKKPPGDHNYNRQWFIKQS